MVVPMPHLQFDLNFTPGADEKRRFAAAVVSRFSAVMDTGTDHVAVTLRCLGEHDLVFGRARGGRVAFLNADIRNGRSTDQKRRLALSIIADLGSLLGVPPDSAYVIYTEHDGENFQLHDRVLPSWSEGEDPLK